MDSNTAILVENLGKEYRIGATVSAGNLRESIMRLAAAPFRRILSPKRTRVSRHHDTIWALRNVSFKIERGEVVGFIGRNGAGKSTLLKILSRITEPTEGSARIRGRVGSLLEVGTGFHPELTGRENVYLNGAILGLTKVEMDRKFDQIVDFAEIGAFLDTPVKRYSSGMRVRLGFAVAAHLDPEVLIVDEVLAVGDVAFQKKCLGKLHDVATGGRTVLFVSHNMAAISRLCGRALWIHDGRILCDDQPDETIERYLHKTREASSGECLFADSEMPGNDSVRLRSVRILNADGEPVTHFDMDDEIFVETRLVVYKDMANLHAFVGVYTDGGTLVLGSGSWDSLTLDDRRICRSGDHVAVCRIPGHLLNRGHYHISLNGQVPGRGFIFQRENILGFEVSEFGGAGGAKSAFRPGLVRPLLQWRFEPAAMASSHQSR